jgi:hypothetical protein
VLEKREFYSKILNPAVCVALVRKVADQIGITVSQILRQKNELVTSIKLTNFLGLTRSGLGPDMAHRPPA